MRITEHYSKWYKKNQHSKMIVQITSVLTINKDGITRTLEKLVNKKVYNTRGETILIVLPFRIYNRFMSQFAGLAKQISDRIKFTHIRETKNNPVTWAALQMQTSLCSWYLWKSQSILIPHKWRQNVTRKILSKLALLIQLCAQYSYR